MCVYIYTHTHIYISPQNGILFSHKKKQITDTSYSLEEPWKYYTKWKKPAIKDHIVHGSFHMK